LYTVAGTLFVIVGLYFGQKAKLAGKLNIKK